MSFLNAYMISKNINMSYLFIHLIHHNIPLRTFCLKSFIWLNIFIVVIADKVQ